MSKNADMKVPDQLALLEAIRVFTDTGKFNGLFTYPNCGVDLLDCGLITEQSPHKITIAGRAALFLAGKGEDPTTSKAVHEFTISLPTGGSKDDTKSGSLEGGDTGSIKAGKGTPGTAGGDGEHQNSIPTDGGPQGQEGGS